MRAAILGTGRLSVVHHVHGLHDLTLHEAADSLRSQRVPSGLAGDGSRALARLEAEIARDPAASPRLASRLADLRLHTPCDLKSAEYAVHAGYCLWRNMHLPAR